MSVSTFLAGSRFSHPRVASTADMSVYSDLETRARPDCTVGSRKADSDEECWETGKSCRATRCCDNDFLRHKWGSIPGLTFLCWMAFLVLVLSVVDSVESITSRVRRWAEGSWERRRSKRTATHEATIENMADATAEETAETTKNSRESTLEKRKSNRNCLTVEKRRRRIIKKLGTGIEQHKRAFHREEIKKNNKNKQNNNQHFLNQFAELLSRYHDLLQKAMSSSSSGTVTEADSTAPHNPFSRIMPEPGSRSAPTFDGDNVTEFLDRWEELCSQCGDGPNDPVFIRKLRWYCKREHRTTVEMLPGYEENDWKKFKKQLLLTYQDLDQYSIAWNAKTIYRYFDKQERLGVNLDVSLKNFGPLAKKLIAKKAIHEWEACQLLLKGVPKTMAAEVLKTMKFESWSDREEFDGKFSDMWDCAMGIRMASKVLEEIMNGDSSDSTTPVPPTVTPSAAQPTPNDPEKAIDDLIGKFANLSLSEKNQIRSRVLSCVRIGDSYRQLESAVFNQVLELYKRANETPRGNPTPRPTAGPNRYDQQRPRGQWRCYYCDQEGHSQGSCMFLQEDEQKGWVRKDHRGWILLGKAEGSDAYIPNDRSMRDNLSKREWVRNREGGAKARMAHISEYDEEYEEEVVGRSSRSRYFASKVRSNRSANSNGYSTFQDENGVTQRFTADYPVEVYEKRVRDANDRAGAAEKKQKTTKAVDKTADKTAEKAAEEPVVRSEPPKKRTPPKPRKTVESIDEGLTHELIGKGGIIIRTTIADGNITTKVFRDKDSDPVIQQVPYGKKELGKVRNVRFADSDDDDDEEEEELGEDEVIRGSSSCRECNHFGNDNRFRRPLYARSSPSTIGMIGSAEVEFLFDSGSEICVMPEDVYQQIEGEVAFRRAEWEMVSVDGGRDILEKVCPQTPIEIHGITLSLPVFVSKNTPRQVILGRPFETLSRMETVNRDDGSCLITIRSADEMEGVNFVACPAQTPRDKPSVEAGNRPRMR